MNIKFTDVNTGFSVSNNGVIQKTTDGGVYWLLLNSGTTKNLKGLHFINSQTGWVVGDSSAVFTTTNGGSNWYGQSITPLKTLTAVKFFDAQTGWATTYDSTIYKTTNGGAIWVPSVINGSSFLCDIKVIDASTLFVSGNSVFKSTNSGLSWISVLSSGYNAPIYPSMSFLNSQTGWVSNMLGGISKTTNGGASWKGKIAGLYNLKSVFFTDANTGWVVGYNGTIMKTVTGGVFVQNISSEIPKEFSLYQNYPNPFNPFTVIRFQLSVAGNAALNIYDMLGRKVSTLVNEKLQPGTYEVTFDGSNLSSGIYFYQFKTDKFSETKKLILLK